MSERSTAKLKATIKLGGDTYRIVSIGKYSAGYDDQLMLQKQGLDILGEPVWHTECSASKEHNDSYLLLQLLAEGCRL